MTTNGPPGSHSTRSRKMLVALFVAIAAWGVYLAVGATGVFTDVELFDSRRAVIVLLCSTLFLGSWLGVLTYRAASKPAESGVATPVNWASLLSLAMVLMGFVLWVLAHLVWQAGEGARYTTVLGWMATILFGISPIAALIGASDPRPSRGKLTALVTLLLLFLAIVLFVWQVRRYVRTHSPLTAVTSLRARSDPPAAFRTRHP